MFEKDVPLEYFVKITIVIVKHASISSHARLILSCVLINVQYISFSMYSCFAVPSRVLEMSFVNFHGLQRIVVNMLYDSLT